MSRLLLSSKSGLCHRIQPCNFLAAHDNLKQSAEESVAAFADRSRIHQNNLDGRFLAAFETSLNASLTEARVPQAAARRAIVKELTNALTTHHNDKCGAIYSCNGLRATLKEKVLEAPDTTNKKEMIQVAQGCEGGAMDLKAHSPPTTAVEPPVIVSFPQGIGPQPHQGQQPNQRQQG